jgi:hypothetical protein
LFSRLFSRAATPRNAVSGLVPPDLGHHPQDLPLYRQALRHSSAVVDDRPDLPDNERLEFLGDAILDAMSAICSSATYPDKGRRLPDPHAQQAGEPHQLNTAGQAHPDRARAGEQPGRNHEPAYRATRWRP